jgi:hypothetical protein
LPVALLEERVKGMQWLYTEFAQLAESKIKEEEARVTELERQLREVKEEPKKQHSSSQGEQKSKEELLLERAKVRGKWVTAVQLLLALQWDFLVIAESRRGCEARWESRITGKFRKASRYVGSGYL